MYMLRITMRRKNEKKLKPDTASNSSLVALTVDTVDCSFSQKVEILSHLMLYIVMLAKSASPLLNVTKLTDLDFLAVLTNVDGLPAVEVGVWYQSLSGMGIVHQMIRALDSAVCLH